MRPDANDSGEDAKEEIRVALFSRDECRIFRWMFTRSFLRRRTKREAVRVGHVDLKHIRFKKSRAEPEHAEHCGRGIRSQRDSGGAIQKDVEMRLKEETFDARLAAAYR